MLLRPTREVEAPRRVITLHLLFGVASVALLTIGIVQVVLGLRSETADSKAMALMTKATSLVSSDFRHRDGDRIQPLMEQFAVAYGLAHCALIGPKGTYIAHSIQSRIQEPAIESAGTVAQFGDIEKHAVSDSKHHHLTLYRSPVRVGDEIVATLEAASQPQEMLDVLAGAARHGLLFVLLGLALLVAGCVFLHRAVGPMAEIERQLRRAATEDIAKLSWEPVKSNTLPCMGWNRLVDELTRRIQQSDLDAKVAAGIRSHREKRADAILRSLTDGVALTDHEDRITFANPSLQGLLNVSDDQLLGQTMDGIMHFSASANGARKFIDPQFRSQQVVTELGRDGDMAQGVLRVARVPLITHGHEASPSHVWMIRDVTQQKLADQMRNQFVYSATHELRTPLANIKAFAETLAQARTMDVEQQKEFCNTINSEATRLSRFIDDLLSISRMESGGMSLQKHDTDMLRLMDDVVSKVRPEMDSKRILFNLSVPAKLPRLFVDKDKLTVALVNLLGNAVKYTPEGGHVSLDVERNGDQLDIHVLDTGIGIAQEELAKVFDKFFRSNDPRVRDRTGSGLGLSIAHEIVRLHGGKMLVHSELDKGSKFTIVLPIA